MINLFKRLFSTNNKNFKIFVLGCQRSGTTLLRLILNSHPKIYCYGELKGYSYFEKNFRSQHNKKYEAFQLPIWTELFSEYDCIKEYKQEQDKILFVFRDPKQTISSMKSLYCYRKDCWFGANDLLLDKNYINYEVVPNVNVWMNDDSRSFNKKFSEEIKKYKNTKNETLIKAICYWKYKNLAYFEMKKNNYKILAINYNSLVLDPKKELEKIMKFLEIKYDKNLLYHHKKQHDEIHNNFGMGQIKSNRQIDIMSINKWKHNIDAEEAEFIDTNTKMLMTKLLEESKSLC